MYQVQLRDEQGVLTFVETLAEAFTYAEEHPEVWKISFSVPSKERVRLVRTPQNEWLYEPIVLP